MSSIANQTSKLLLPFNHILQVQDKLLRKQIPLAFNYWLKLPHDKLHEIVNTVNTLHNSSLLVDDIQDNSIMRRTIPAAHVVYGLPLTINASIHVMCMVLEKVVKLKHPEVTKVYSEQLLEVARGQGIDIYWRDNLIIPTEEEYRQMVIEKTGGMFPLATRLMQLFSENKNDHTNLTKLIAFYFQIRDDYCNLAHQEASEDWPGGTESQGIRGANYCEDIPGGKFSLPIINALQNPEGQPLLNLMRLRTRDKRVKRYFLSELRRLGSMQYTRDVLSQLDRQIRSEVLRLGGNPDMENVLNELLSWQKVDKGEDIDKHFTS